MNKPKNIKKQQNVKKHEVDETLGLSEEKYNKCESLFNQYITSLRNLDEDSSIKYENDAILHSCIKSENDNVKYL